MVRNFSSLCLLITTNVPAADSLAFDHVKILEEVTDKIKQSQLRYTAQANKTRRPMHFKENDLDMVKNRKEETQEHYKAS